MSAIFRTAIAGWALGAALGIPSLGAADTPGAKPGDDAMTCEEIATELSPYVQQIAPSIQALASTQQQLYAQGRQMGEARKAEREALTPLATAGALDNTGASKRAYQLALMAQMAREKSENEAFANSPLAKENKAQAEQLAAQGQQMQSDARLQRLMQLAQQKHCDKK